VELIGPQEIAQLLGVSRQRVGQLTKRGDFPKPVAVLAMGQIWDADEVRQWADKRRAKT
jgi:prophage regulatory protein